MKTYIKDIILYSAVIAATVVILTHLQAADNKSTESEIKALNGQIDSLQLCVDSNNIHILHLDSITTVYKTKVEEDKKKLSELQLKTNLYRTKYNEEHTRIDKLSNTAVVSEFTDAFD